MIDAIENNEQENIIRKRLKSKISNEYKSNEIINYYKLYNAINGKPYEINRTTLTKTIEGPGNLNLICVIGLCKFFNIDPAWLFSHPNMNDDEFSEMKFIEGKRFQDLNDLHYSGSFFGYCYSQKPVSNGIDFFTLNISANNKKANLKMRISENDIREYVGTPILVAPDTVFILFKSELGEYIFMTFTYSDYKTTSMYYRQGAFSTHSREQKRCPLIQNFVLFDREIEMDEEHKQLISGLLSMNSDIIHIPEEKFNAICENEKIKRTFENLLSIDGSPIVIRPHQYYTINESSFIKAINPTNIDDAVYALLLLKSISTDPKKLAYPHNELYAKFSKEL